MRGQDGDEDTRRKADRRVLLRSLRLRKLFGASRFNDTFTDVELDAQTAFVCWNIVVSVIDCVMDARGGCDEQALQLEGHKVEELLEYVAAYLDPTKRKEIT